MHDLSSSPEISPTVSSIDPDTLVVQNPAATPDHSSTHTPSSHPPKKLAVKYLVASFVGILGVVGLVAASVLARNNQDVRQQASGYANCISPRTGASLTHSQRECQGNTTFSTCNNGALIPGTCPTGQTCQQETGLCTRKPCFLAGYGAIADGETICTDFDSFSTCNDGVLSSSSRCTPAGVICDLGACQPPPSPLPSTAPSSYPICQPDKLVSTLPVSNSSPCKPGFIIPLPGASIVYQCNPSFTPLSETCILTSSLPTCRSSSGLMTSSTNFFAEPCLLNNTKGYYECRVGLTNVNGKCEVSKERKK